MESIYNNIYGLSVYMYTHTKYMYVLFDFSTRQLRRGRIGSQVAKATPMSGKIFFVFQGRW